MAPVSLSGFERVSNVPPADTTGGAGCGRPDRVEPHRILGPAMPQSSLTSTTNSRPGAPFTGPGGRQLFLSCLCDNAAAHEGSPK